MKANSAIMQFRGISLVEILIVVAVLAVIGAIALPKPEKVSAKEEMRTAIENLQQAVYLARSTAISKHSAVIMHLQSSQPKNPGKVSFSLVDPTAGSDAGALDQIYRFPPEIRLEASVNDVLFDPQGRVEHSSRVELISNRDAEFNQRVLIE